MKKLELQKYYNAYFFLCMQFKNEIKTFKKQDIIMSKRVTDY